ncbi:MAG: SAM-dependent methyltransferase [Pseudomonadota bacterium]
MLTITIKQGKEKSVLAREIHIYASAVDRVDGKPGERLQPGATAVVQTSSGQFLARAGFNPVSQIRARVWSFDAGEAIDHAFIKRRVQQALSKRVSAALRSTSGRLLHAIKGEEDGLSGLVVDWYTGEPGEPGYLVCQFLAAGVDAWKVPIVQSLIKETGCPNVYERSDTLMRKAEGLADVSGALAGEEPPNSLVFSERGVHYRIDLKTGSRHKGI